MLAKQYGELTVPVTGIDLAAKKVGGKRISAAQVSIDIIPFLVNGIVQYIGGVNDPSVFSGQHFISQ